MSEAFVPKARQDLAGGFSRRNAAGTQASAPQGAEEPRPGSAAAVSAVPSGLDPFLRPTPAAEAAGQILLSLRD